jgi:hypothetical protein
MTSCTTHRIFIFERGNLTRHFRYFHSSYKDTFTTPILGPNVGKGESLRRADTKMHIASWDPTIKSAYQANFDDARFGSRPLKEPSRYSNILNDTIQLGKIGHASTPKNLIAKEKAACARRLAEMV